MAAILIASVGYLIFEAAFIGTFRELFLPFLWGFSVDVGLAGVQQFAAPLIAKPLT